MLVILAPRLCGGEKSRSRFDARNSSGTLIVNPYIRKEFLFYIIILIELSYENITNTSKQLLKQQI